MRLSAHESLSFFSPTMSFGYPLVTQSSVFPFALTLPLPSSLPFTPWFVIRLSGRDPLRLVSQLCALVDFRCGTIAAASFQVGEARFQGGPLRSPAPPLRRKTRQKCPSAAVEPQKKTGPPGPPLMYGYSEAAGGVGIFGKISVGIWEGLPRHIARFGGACVGVWGKS